MSPGGNLSAAMKIGRLFRVRSIHTEAPYVYTDNIGRRNDNLREMFIISNASRLPSFSDSRESIVEDRLLGEHCGEALDERGQLLIGHVRHEVVEHSALAKQRMGAALCGV